HPGTEIVWLKDVTDRFQTSKRLFGVPDLPDQLTFHMRRESSDSLKLTLQRNYEIDPNADIYFVEKTKDGRSIMSKSETLELETLAYYQDLDNGAYMTVRCINSLNKICERVISGNIQIGERSYDLRPVETDVAKAKVMEDREIIGRRYILLDQTYTIQDHFIERQEPKVIFSPQENESEYDFQDDTLTSLNLAELQDKGSRDTIRQQKQNYYVKVALCIDSSVWDLYFAKVDYVHPSRKREEVKRRIREAYSHIMNGVNLRYKTIKDPSISISIIPFEFVYFLHEVMFPHNVSRVRSVNGIKYIDASQYLDDFGDWDRNERANDELQFDHAMLFTT
ncbi:hypothetical protein ACJMK2_002878, partial [Sinanodonta woodiana]